MKKLSFLLALLLSFSLMLSACNTSTQNQSDGDDSKTDVKTLTYAIATETTLLSPLYMGNFSSVTLPYETLVKYDGGEIVPVLAESWEFNDDGTSLTFHLRSDVTFHDGSAFDAEAVKVNLEHKHSNPAFYTLKAVTDIESIEVVDETTLTIHYSHPYFAYLNDFCWQDVMTIVSPDLIIPDDFQTVTDVIGTGPYVRDEIVEGQYTRFIRNEDYWGEEPYYDEIIVKYIPDSASRIQALETGEIDMIYGSALLSYEEYQQAISMDGIEGQIAELDTRARDITLNASSDKLSDLKVRQAIGYAIDKNEISEGLTYGYEEIADIPFTLDSPYSDVPLNTTFTHDLEKANALLDEAGWVMNDSTGIREKDGEPFSINITMEEGFDSLNAPLATLLKSQLAEVGIDLSVKSQEVMEWYADFVAGNYDITIWEPQYAYASPHCWFTPMSAQTPQTAALEAMSDKEEFFAAIEEFTTTDDPDRLTEIFTYLINYDLDNVIDIPLTYSKDMIVYNSEKISRYEFKGIPCFLDVTQITAK